MATKKRVIMSRRQLHAICESVLACDTLESACDTIQAAADKLPRYTIKFDKEQGRRRRYSCGWKVELSKLADGLRRGSIPFRIFMPGNSKLPFVSFSTLPKYTCPGAGACLEYCYSFKAWRFPAGFSRQLQNTLLLRFAKRAIAQEWNGIAEGAIVRLYVDGDFDSMATLAFWFRLCSSRDDLEVYGYSKSWQLFADWKAQELAFPTNYLLNLSDGSKYDSDSDMVETMESLPVTRGWFRAVDVVGKYAKGFARYDSKEYHREVRSSLRSEFPKSKALSCPGKCGDCLPSGKHACGSREFVGLNIGIGIHGSVID